MKSICRNGHHKIVGQMCKTCKRDRAKRHNANPEIKLKNKARRRKRARANQRHINDYLKEHPCVDCDERDPTVLEFDHVKGKHKRRDVTGMSLMAWETILKEIEKCEVVCSNDHSRRTARRANTLRWRLNNPKKGE
jgi:hypothetical protein